MTVDLFQEEFSARWCESLEVVETGVNSFLLRTPFVEPDGDELTVVVTHGDSGWELSDLGHTAAHLGFLEFEFTPGRSERFLRLVHRSGLALRQESEVVHRLNRLPTPVDVADFLQVLAQVRGLPSFEAEKDVEFFVRSGKKTIASWFLEDFRVPNWRHKQDTEKAFVVDLHIEPTPGFGGIELFIVGNSEKADRSANVATQLREWNSEALPVAVVSDATDRKSLVRLQSRLGRENVINAQMDHWAPVYSFLEHHNAPILPAGAIDNA